MALLDHLGENFSGHEFTAAIFGRALSPLNGVTVTDAMVHNRLGIAADTVAQTQVASILTVYNLKATATAKSLYMSTLEYTMIMLEAGWITPATAAQMLEI